MKILVCMKQVPLYSSNFTISETKDSVKEEGLTYEANEADLYAVEEALYQRGIHEGDITVVTVGPNTSKQVLYTAYAKGVDWAVHIVDEEYKGKNDAFALSAIGNYIKTHNQYDLILTGVRADDDLLGQFGVSLSDYLSMPVVTSISGLSIKNGSTRTATVLREIGDGYKQEIEVDLPCVLTIQFGIRPLQYTSVMASIKARSKKIEIVIPEKSGESRNKLRTVELYPPQESSECEFITGSPVEVCQKLFDKVLKVS